MQPLESYSLFDPEIAESPFAYYAELRKRAPVYKMPIGMWIVSSHALCLEAMRDAEAFSSKFIQAMGLPGSDAQPGDIDEAAIVGPSTLLANDPPSHTHFRKLVNKAFSPNRVKKISHSIEQISDALIAKIETQGRFEAITDFAIPLPLTVIADQLGVSRNDLARFKKWSDATVLPISGMATPEQLLESLELTKELQAYFLERIEERRLERRDDMLSDLVYAQLDGERPLADLEIVSVLLQFLVAGNETTTSLLGAWLQYALQSPAELAKVQADRSLLPNSIEEAVRLETPVSGMWRVTTRNVKLGDEEIPKGSMVMLRYAAANRDEAIFEDAEAFKADRPNVREHLGFGMGVHYCPGAALAREEARIGLGMILDRLPNLRLGEDNDFAHNPSMLLRGLKKLNLEFDPAK
ncbi:MAG: cytochrome P450 [Deltaproteobacteria bacterium]|nr:cytochrome P450 [Deltaproteobacteria bacterium]